jgi:hypothetical protein
MTVPTKLGYLLLPQVLLHLTGNSQAQFIIVGQELFLLDQCFLALVAAQELAARLVPAY